MQFYFKVSFKLDVFDTVTVQGQIYRCGTFKVRQRSKKDVWVFIKKAVSKCKKKN